MKEMCMHRVAAKFVPRILTADQKQQRVDVCTELNQLASNDETPDMAPCDFFIFPKMKLKLKGRRFDTTEEIQAESQRVHDRKRFPQSVPKMEEMAGPVSTCRGELLRG
jgi:hypothetical protein